ncbi:zinc-ribbon_6 domain-containing protein [Rhodovastum atsumiense]|uniref:Zinc-ribbon domain-containing protein n=1 Tax=Rhodovastum atsumiense TaxID=504468 RepID=A0A5M6IT25_9PROT|nr:putative zinc-binding peptidase [Rhodovastum atsumiense]KAA5611473.1 hypothetical protein F1189_14165 [Rhodovastum atsumiense]CAH2601163.1 zinc-ribbon_6 domain-containing protein [Rhodovastum atsumiense]
MKLFKCQACDQLLYFENTKCERSQHRLGYLADAALLSALEEEQAGWHALGRPGRTFRFCANAAHDACNWLVPAGSAEAFCASCRHNRTIPDLTSAENLRRWRKLEIAKHRLFYTLLRLGLPLANRVDDPEHGLVFDFLADAPDPTGPKVLTGHDNGIITINVKEADDKEREAMRAQMREPYRTLLGHFRHEVGHYFWDVLVRDGGFLDAFRERFGDERQDYDAALQKNYREGPPADWQEHFVSTYASCHPWEDFAETWAHYLHIVDTLEMAASFGISVRPRITRDPDLATEIDFDPHQAKDVETLVEAWLPLTFAVNSLNRAMGQPDLYPFILSAEVIDKLGFIHRIVHASARPVP